MNQLILFIVLCAAFGIRQTVAGLIILGVAMKIQFRFPKFRLTMPSISLGIYRTYVQGLKNMVMNSRYANRSLTLSADELQNPALLVAALLRQDFAVSAESPISVLGGGSRNPAIVIWQFVKHMPKDQQIETLIKRESVLSDYYNVLRNDGVKKEVIYSRVDSARQFYIQTGKHDAKVMKAIAGIASEQIEESLKETREQKKRGDSAVKPFNGNDTRTSTPLVDTVYTVNDSAKLMVKVTKELANGDYRVAMVSGEVLPKGSKVMLDGVATHYTVGAIVGKNMTLTSKSLGQRIAESQAQATPVVASKPVSSAKDSAPTKAEVLAKVMAMLAAIED